MQVPLSSKLKRISAIHKHSSRMYEYSHAYKFIRMRGPDLKGFAEMAVWKGAVVQPRLNSLEQILSTSSKKSPALPPGTDEEGVAQQTDTKVFPSEQAPTNIPSALHIPANVLSKEVSHVEIQSSSESRQSEESASDKSRLEAHRVDSGFSASNGSSEENSEREECTDSATKSEAHKKGNPRFCISFRLH